MKSDSSIVKNSMWKFAERILAQAISFLVSIILARLLLPEDYGAVSMVMVFIEIANAFVIHGLGNSLIQKKEADDLDFSSVFYFNVIMSIILYIVLFVLSGPISGFYNMSVLSPVLKVLGLRIILAAVNSVQQAYVSKHMMFRKFFWSTFIGTAASAVVGIIMAFCGAGVWALVAQYMINSVMDTVVLFLTVDWRPKLIYSWKRISGLVKYGWKILLEGLSTTVEGQIRSLIIGRVYTSDDLAYYDRGMKLSSILINNISASLSAVLFPAMSNEQTDKNKVLVLMRKTVVLSTYVLFPLIIGLALVSNSFIEVLLTRKWIGAVPYLQIFCVFQLFTIGMITRHQAVKALGRSDVFMLEHLFPRITGMVILLFVFRKGIFYIILSSAVPSVMLLIITKCTSKAVNGYGYLDQIKDIAPPLILSILMAVPVVALEYVSLIPIIKLTVQVVSGAAVYIGASVIFKPEGYKLVMQYVYRFLNSHKKGAEKS